MGKNILQYLFSGYLKLLKKTVAIEWQEIQFVTGNQVFGFWHEDSFLMNLVLEELSGKTSPVDVIVTADTGVFCGNFSFLSWMSSAVLEMGPLCDSTSVFENQRRSSRLWRS